MDFVLLVLVILNPISGVNEVGVASFATHQECEAARRQAIDEVALVLPAGVELRARCISTEQLLPSI